MLTTPLDLPTPLDPLDILTVDEVIDELSIARAKVIPWLDEWALILKLERRRRVVWGEVLAAIRGRVAPEIREAALAKLKASRKLWVQLPLTKAF